MKSSRVCCDAIGQQRPRHSFFNFQNVAARCRVSYFRENLPDFSQNVSRRRFAAAENHANVAFSPNARLNKIIFFLIFSLPPLFAARSAPIFSLSFIFLLFSRRQKTVRFLQDFPKFCQIFTRHGPAHPARLKKTMVESSERLEFTG